MLCIQWNVIDLFASDGGVGHKGLQYSEKPF